MKLFRTLLLPAAALVATFHLAGHAPAAAAPRISPVDTGKTSSLSVLSYNVKGLPWPVATGRPGALTAIGDRLAELRRQGKQPHIVVLQEVFTSEARRIGAIGGYRYTALGPSAGAADDTETGSPPLGAHFAREASWLKGEKEGKWVDSGLEILSDYPLISVRRFEFPEGACAGYDCLAAKGVLLARVKLPGQAQPVTIVDTHLNSRGASGVSDARADRAYAWQIDAVRRFVKANVAPGDPVVFAGDFNFHAYADRLRDLKADGGPLPGAREALQLAVADDAVASGDRKDALAIVARGCNREYFRSGTLTRLALSKVSVPFGKEPDGTQLSDHMGFVADFSLSQPS